MLEANNRPLPDLETRGVEHRESEEGSEEGPLPESRGEGSGATTEVGDTKSVTTALTPDPPLADEGFEFAVDEATSYDQRVVGGGGGGNGC